jgi:hypothetical protein
LTFKFCALHLTKEQFDWVIAKANEEGCLPSQVIGALIDEQRAHTTLHALKHYLGNEITEEISARVHAIGALIDQEREKNKCKNS